MFDVFVLFFVGYSCFTSVFSVAFRYNDEEVSSTEYTSFWDYFNVFVELLFFFDLFLNFIHAIKHPETYEDITDMREIAKNYMKGWFSIDFVSVFPFQILLPGTGKTTKLFRLFRLPRLLKLFDIGKFSKMVKSLMSNNSSRDERIVAQYMMLYIYKILRLNIIAIFITYIIGCMWYFICFLID